MSWQEIKKLESEIYEQSKKLLELRKNAPEIEVTNYSFKTLDGDKTLLDFFGQKDKLFVIHNMGQGCRYCTLWADGINPFLLHLENTYSVVLVSKDAPELQRTFANSRGWRFRMASHGGGKYISEQTVSDGENQPGIVFYERKNGKIFKKNFSPFGPLDQFCSLWNIISLAGDSEDTWVPQFNYWKRPEKMDDGGNNLL